MGVGCSGRICLYRSRDFASWRDAGAISVVPGEHMWECVDAFPLDAPSEDASPGGGAASTVAWAVKASLQKDPAGDV